MPPSPEAALRQRYVLLKKQCDQALAQLRARTDEHNAFAAFATAAMRSPITGHVYLRADTVLVRNAAKFTADGGKVTVSLARRDGTAEIRVRDTGSGIGPELLPRIFEPLTQAKQSLARSQGGLGLGLTIVKGIVELHGGTVTAESEGAGRGSEFVVRLPLARSVPETKADAAPGPPASKRHSILVVECSDTPAVAVSWQIRSRWRTGGPLELE